MKKIIGLLAFLATSSALAAPPKHSGDDVLIWPTRQAKIGDTVDLSTMVYTLHVGEKCTLPLANTKHFRRLDVHSGATSYVGCWGMTLDNSVVMVAPDGKTTVDSLVIFGRASVNRDGTATIQYPSYSQR
ncbi:hypothetical protein [Burkholderia arboris]|uniref:hypothetical protein n=1 Tax=Burkholderia arboris TaxID=488730 RepID=UPI00210DBC8A|nr:hypothetical protein [Burkholderia arboris]UTV55783.1 hypothetical protein NLX30_05210 [Burkholderia arboris]